MKFVLLHDAKSDDGVKAFFMDVWELYIKVSSDETMMGKQMAMADGSDQAAMNPFHTAHTAIKSSVFDTRVRASAKKYL